MNRFLLLHLLVIVSLSSRAQLDPAITSWVINIDNATLDVSKWQKGLYVIDIITLEGESSMNKIIIE